MSSNKVQDMTKADLEKLIQSVINKELSKSKNKIISEQEFRKMVREMLKKQYRLFWEKASFFTDKL